VIKLFEVLYALYCARRVLYLIPKDRELRRLALDAIHAAESWILDPTAENRQKCRDAADAAYAAAEAVDAAAAYAAADAVDAAARAADAADWTDAAADAWAAADAAWAADAAARAADAAWAAAAERQAQREWYDELEDREAAYLQELAEIERRKLVRQREILEHCTGQMLAPIEVGRVLL